MAESNKKERVFPVTTSKTYPPSLVAFKIKTGHMSARIVSKVSFWNYDRYSNASNPFLLDWVALNDLLLKNAKG